MTKNPNWLSIAAVHRRTGKARSTIASHIRKGELSVVLDDKGNKFIEASEAARFYGVEFDLNDAGSSASNTKRIEKNSVPTVDNTALIQEMKNHRESLDEIIKGLRNDLDKSQEREEKKLMLLTHQSESSENIEEAVKNAVREEIKEELDQLRNSLAAKDRKAKELGLKLRKEMNRSWLDRVFRGRRGAGSK